MLKKATQKDIEAIISFCSDDLMGTRIACYCLAYGFDRDFLGVWINEHEGKIKAVIVKFFDSISIKLGTDCEKEEIRDFCQMLGYDEMTLTETDCQVLDFKYDSIKKSYIFDGEAAGYSAENLGEEYYEQLYSLISEAIPGSFKNSKEAYLSWLSDFSFRKKRNLARSKGITEDGELLSCLMTSSETDSAAILSGVACKTSQRKSGLGKSTVLSAVRELLSENKKVYVIALNASARGFYEHIGFKFNENIVSVKG